MLTWRTRFGDGVVVRCRPTLEAKRTGVLVIRAWLEDGAETDTLRARITRTSDIAEAAASQEVSASETEILAIVRSWLREVVAHQ